LDESIRLLMFVGRGGEEDMNLFCGMLNKLSRREGKGISMRESLRGSTNRGVFNKYFSHFAMMEMKKIFCVPAEDDPSALALSCIAFV
jgi:hypothetical protein